MVSLSAVEFRRIRPVARHSDRTHRKTKQVALGPGRLAPLPVGARSRKAAEHDSARRDGVAGKLRQA